MSPPIEGWLKFMQIKEYSLSCVMVTDRRWYNPLHVLNGKRLDSLSVGPDHGLCTWRRWAPISHYFGFEWGLGVMCEATDDEVALRGDISPRDVLAQGV